MIRCWFPRRLRQSLVSLYTCVVLFLPLAFHGSDCVNWFIPLRSFCSLVNTRACLALENKSLIYSAKSPDCVVDLQIRDTSRYETL